MLSELTDAELLEFVQESGIVIPNGFASTESGTANIIRYWVELIEADPDITFAYNHGDLHMVSTALVSAVNSYYGIVLTDADGSDVAPCASHGLRHNTVYSVPDDMEEYNCYSYALGLTGSIYNPGCFSGVSLTQALMAEMEDAKELAGYVVNDLKSSTLGYDCVKHTTIMPTPDSVASGQTAICVKIGDIDHLLYDYHFMRLASDGTWRHKPGKTAILTYDYAPIRLRVWYSEGYNGVTATYSELAYDSPTEYIVFAEDHDFAGTATGYNYHSGLMHYYEYYGTCTQCDSSETYFVSERCYSCNDGGFHPIV